MASTRPSTRPVPAPHAAVAERGSRLAPGQRSGFLPATAPVSKVEVAARQASLLDPPTLRPGFDAAFANATRHDLSHGAWVEVVAGFATGTDGLFDLVVEQADWGTQQMVMYEQIVDCPRLTAHWPMGELPAGLGVLRAMAAAISQRHRVALTRVSANLYRDGRDSVAWHGDRGARDRRVATVAVLTLGATRPFRLRAREGAGRLGLRPAAGDLLVMGGTCQRTWQHAVPKVADAGPRLSVMFREATTDW